MDFSQWLSLEIIYSLEVEMENSRSLELLMENGTLLMRLSLTHRLHRLQFQTMEKNFLQELLEESSTEYSKEISLSCSTLMLTLDQSMTYPSPQKEATNFWVSMKTEFPKFGIFQNTKQFSQHRQEDRIVDRVAASLWMTIRWSQVGEMVLLDASTSKDKWSGMLPTHIEDLSLLSMLTQTTSSQVDRKEQ